VHNRLFTQKSTSGTRGTSEQPLLQKLFVHWRSADFPNIGCQRTLMDRKV